MTLSENSGELTEVQWYAKSRQVDWSSTGEWRPRHVVLFRCPNVSSCPPVHDDRWTQIRDIQSPISERTLDYTNQAKAIR